MEPTATQITGPQVRLPDADAEVDQDEEWCEVLLDGEWQRVRFHDYDEIYKIPGFYEKIFYEVLECDSPRTLHSLIAEELDASDRDAGELRVLDLGAGNGMVGEQLAELGVGEITGVDIIEEAAAATERDRPGIYSDYVITDLTQPPPEIRSQLAERRFNCLTSVAALGFGDIPPQAFAQAFSLIEEDGLIGFSIKESMVGDKTDHSGFFDLVDQALNDGTMELSRSRRYQHRLATTGEPLYYIAMIAHKRGELPPEALEL